MDLQRISLDSNSTVSILSIGGDTTPNCAESDRECSPFSKYNIRNESVVTFFSLNLMRTNPMETPKSIEHPIISQRCNCEIY